MKLIAQIIKNKWLQLLILLVLLAGLAVWLRPVRNPREGFTQNTPYAMKRGEAAYDGFYAGIHDYLYNTKQTAKTQVDIVLANTQATVENSRILDLGCGTGCVVSELAQKGYNIQGADPSVAMIEHGKQSHSVLGSAKCPMMAVSNMSDPMNYERGSFSHILCLNRTIYTVRDKVAFLRTCNYWLQPGGYLVLQLADPAKYNTVVPIARPQKVNGITNADNITNTEIDFSDFTYKSKYDFAGLDKTAMRGEVVQTETFVDKASGYIRQNEHILLMESPQDILNSTQLAGFLAEGVISLEDEDENIYVLRKL